MTKMTFRNKVLALVFALLAMAPALAQQISPLGGGSSSGITVGSTIVNGGIFGNYLCPDSSSPLPKLANCAPGALSTNIQAGITPTTAYSANQLMYSDGTVAQALAFCTTGVLVYTVASPGCSPTLPNGLNISALTSRGGLTQVSGYQITPATGAVNFGPSAGETTFDFITYGQLLRVNQSGTITQAKFAVPALTGITTLQIVVWRQQPGTIPIGTAAPTTATGSFDQVGISANLVGSLSVGVNTLAVSIPNVQVGDYLGMHVAYSGGATVQNFISTAIGNTSSGNVPTVVYSVTNATPSTVQYNWKGQTALSGSAVFETAYMIAPIIATTGDSINSGAIGGSYWESGYNFCDNWNPQFQNDIAWATHLLRLFQVNLTLYNCGISGNTTTQMLARFATDITAHHPVITIINGGVNDVGAGVAQATIQSNIMAMLAAGVADGQRVFVVGITPSGGAFTGTAPSQLRDAVNAYLAINVPLNGGTYIDPGPMGQYYAAALSPNNNDLFTQSNDGLHPNRQGHIEFAQLIYNGMIGGPRGISSYLKSNISTFQNTQTGGYLGVGLTNVGGLTNRAPLYRVDVSDTTQAQMRISGWSSASTNAGSAELILGNDQTANIYGKLEYDRTNGRYNFTNMFTAGAAGSAFRFIVNGNTTPLVPVTITPSGLAVTSATSSPLVITGYANGAAAGGNGEILFGNSAAANANYSQIYHDSAAGAFNIKNNTSLSFAAINSVLGTTVVSTLLPQGLKVTNAMYIGFSSTAAAGGAVDAAIYRNTAGVIEVNNGTAGTFRDLKLRDLFTNDASFILQSGTTITGGATGNIPTLTVGPVTGNPTKWLPYNDNGTTRYVPSW